MNRIIKYLFLWVEDSLKVLKKTNVRRVIDFYDTKYVERIYKFNCSKEWKCEINELLKYVNFNNCKNVLDYGCNTGELYKKLKTINKKIHYIGVDINKFALKKGKEKEKNNSKFSVIKVKSGQWPNIKKNIDIAIFSHSIGHIENPEYIINSLYKNTSKGAMVGIITPNLYFKISKIMTNLIKGYNADRTVLCYYNKSNLRKLIQNSGFKIKKIWYYGESSFTFFGLTMDILKSRLLLVAVKNIS